MADDFKALVELTKQTNAKLELLHKQGEDNDSPRERLLDALPEILTAKDISKKEIDQKDKLHREEVKKNKNNLEELKKADAERSKESTKNSQSIKQQNQMIVSEGHKDTAMIVDSLGNVEKSQSINEKIQLSLIDKPEGAAQEEQEQKTESFFKKLLDSTEKTSKGIRGLRDGILGLGKSSGASSFFSKILKAGLIGGMIFLVNFLSGPYFDKFYDTVVNTLVPAFVKVYEVLKPIATYIGGALLKLVKDIGGLFGGGEVDEFGVSMGPKSITEVLLDNKAAIATIVALLAPGLLLKGLFAIPLLLTGAFALLAKRGGDLARAFGGASGASGVATRAGAMGAGGMLGGRNVVKMAGGSLSFADPKTGLPTGEMLSKEQTAAYKKSFTDQGSTKKINKMGKHFKRLFAAGRLFGPLGTIIGSVQGLGILLSDMPFEDKKVAFGRLLGETLGAIGLGTLGTVLGAAFLGPVGALVGGIAGAMGGGFAGGLIADILMGGKPPALPSGAGKTGKGMSFYEDNFDDFGVYDQNQGSGAEFMFGKSSGFNVSDAEGRKYINKAIQSSGNFLQKLSTPRGREFTLEEKQKMFSPTFQTANVDVKSNHGIVGTGISTVDLRYATHHN